MRPRLLFALFALLAGCRAEGAPPVQAGPPLPPPTLRDIPLLDSSVVADSTSGEDAARLTFQVPLSLDSVAHFYRARLPALGWQIVSAHGNTARLDLVATKGDRSLWVLAHSMLGPIATEYTLIGSAGRAP